MKKFLTASIAVLLLTVGVIAAPASGANPDDGVTTIQDGTLVDGGNDLIVLGFNDWGYNYQGHMFEGKYCDSYRDAAWCQDYKEDNLSMKWNEAWLANSDANDDGLLDRHLGYSTYIGSGAWLTNHMSGEYTDTNGLQSWNYFVKIIAAPADATNVGGIWYAADNTELGAAIWGQFFVAQSVYNDSGSGDHGIEYVSAFSPGFGKY